MEIGDTHDPYGAIVTGPNVGGCSIAIVGFRPDARATTRKGQRVGCYILVLL